MELYKLKHYISEKDISKKIEGVVENSLKEREDLGLSLPDCCLEVRLDLYPKENASAYITITDENEPVIVVNIPNVALKSNRLDKEKKKILEKTLEHTYKICEFLSLLGIVSSSTNKIEENAKRLGLEEVYNSKKFKSCLQELRKTYENCAKLVMREGMKTYEKIKNLKNDIIEAAAESEFDFLRHEIDHADYISNSKLYKKTHQEITKEKFTHDDVNKILTYLSWDISIAEIRAMFFDYIKPDKWKNADYDEIKKLVFTNFVNNYMGKVPERLINLLACKNREINLLEILNEKMLLWEDEFLNNANRLVNVIGDAYKYKPSLLKDANEAETLDEFIDILS
ncbi:MAG: hypothetical protein J7K72_01230, partial [Candidatus Aenigmarchaeota archaeon]|nr:hypothetical protein [Candidatus Aenigmarchaeota archaeon]